MQDGGVDSTALALTETGDERIQHEGEKGARFCSGLDPRGMLANLLRTFAARMKTTLATCCLVPPGPRVATCVFCRRLPGDARMGGSR